MSTKALQINDFIETEIDKFITSKVPSNYSLLKFLQNLNPSSEDILNFQKLSSLYDILNDVMAAFCKIDEQLKEAYGFLTRPQLNLYKIMLERFIEDLKTYFEISSVPIKKSFVKKPKKIIPEKQISKMQYLKEIEINGEVIESFEPKKLIGKTELYIYDTVQKLLIVYYSNGFIIKGTTIQNFDKTNSIAKRANLTDVDYVLKNPKIPCKKYMNGISNKPRLPSGRINSNCILLKVY